MKSDTWTYGRCGENTIELNEKKEKRKVKKNCTILIMSILCRTKRFALKWHSIKQTPLCHCPAFNGCCEVWVHACARESAHPLTFHTWTSDPCPQL